MRIFLTACTALALAGCSNVPAQDDVKAMLQANDPKVCASSEVQRTALSAVDAKYQRYLDNGGHPLEFHAINSTGIKAEIHEVECSANVPFAAMSILFFDVPAEDLTLSYAVRPSLDNDGSFVVSAQADDAFKTRLDATIRIFESKHQTPTEAQPDAAEEPKAADTPTEQATQTVAATEPSGQADDAASGRALDAAAAATAAAMGGSRPDPSPSITDLDSSMKK